MQKLNGIGFPHLPQIEKEQQKEHGEKQQYRQDHGGGLYRQGEIHIKMNDIEQKETGQFIQDHTEEEAAADGDQKGDRRFTEQHAGDMAFFHAQHIVETQLLFAAADQKAVGIKEKDRTEHRHHPGTHPHQHGHVTAAGEVFAEREIAENKEDGGGDHRSQQKRKVKAAVFMDVAEGQPQIKGITHGAHRLWSASSAYR